MNKNKQTKNIKTNKAIENAENSIINNTHTNEKDVKSKTNTSHKNW